VTGGATGGRPYSSTRAAPAPESTRSWMTSSGGTSCSASPGPGFGSHPAISKSAARAAAGSATGVPHAPTAAGQPGRVISSAHPAAGAPGSGARQNPTSPTRSWSGG